MDVSAIAHVCHEANRAVQIEQNNDTISVSELWENLDVETRESAINGVEGIIAGNNPEESHINWVAFKVDNGWCFGQVKDELKKEHPLLIPYEELPADQRIKDALFYSIVHALADKDING